MNEREREKSRKKTEELMEIIQRSNKNLSQLMEEMEPEQLDMELKDYLNLLLLQKEKTLTQVFQQSNLAPNYGYQIFSGKRTNVSRDKLLALAFGIGMNLEETQTMLKIARQPILYPRIRSDLVVIYALKEHWALTDVNEVLEDLQEPLLNCPSK